MASNKIIGLDMFKKIFIVLYIFFISIANICAKDISPMQAAAEIKNNLLIIDVRSKLEWKETGIIQNAKLIQMYTAARTLRKEYIAEILEVLGNDKSIEAAIICHSGGRSSATVAMLKDQGYINISNIAEGMVGYNDSTGWINRGLPTIKCSQECE
jgi:rhodanese-related sulfurtransferase